jgi:hypothetical protein
VATGSRVDTVRIDRRFQRLQQFRETCPGLAEDLFKQSATASVWRKGFAFRQALQKTFGIGDCLLRHCFATGGRWLKHARRPLELLYPILHSATVVGLFLSFISAYLYHLDIIPDLHPEGL